MLQNSKIAKWLQSYSLRRGEEVNYAGTIDNIDYVTYIIYAGTIPWP